MPNAIELILENEPEYVVTNGFMDCPKLNEKEFERFIKRYSLPVFMFSKNEIFIRFVLYNGFIIEEEK